MAVYQNVGGSMEREKIEEIILEPDPARVMEGLRDTGYDFNTAMADIVDNSIAASATVIKVKVDLNPHGDINVYVADNGCGMNLEGLKNAMRYGSIERIDPNSLGKFGLGLKTASTAFCRSLSLLSKNSKDTDYHKVQWDLDEICRINKWQLLQPKINQDEIDLLEEVTNGDHGTLVIWDKVDRMFSKTYQNKTSQNKAFEKILKNLYHHFAMVYQRYLDSKYSKECSTIELYLNDEKVFPWDPFCTCEKFTKCISTENISVELPDGTKSSFKIEAYVLPRPEEFLSTEARSEARINNDNEGFYIYRENRLIYFGGWLDMFIKDPHISLLRINFSFNHELDDAFKVDIKKSRISLDNEIYDYIQKQFLPAAKREAENIYRKGHNKQIEKIAVGAHDASNNNIASKASSLEASKVEVIDESSGTVEISNSQGKFTGKLKIQNVSKPGQYNVVPVNDIESGLLWEPAIVENNHAVQINQSHEYYKKVYAPNIKNNTLIVGMDSLLWSLAEAELSTYNDETREQYEDMRIQVSRILKKLVADLPDPDLPDSNPNEDGE